MAPDALDPRRRRPRALRAAARHRPLAAAAAGRERRAVRVQARGRPRGRRGLDRRPAEPGPRRAIRSAQNSVCRTFGYARPAWSEPRGAPAGRIEELAVESAAFGEAAHRAGLPAGGLRSGRGAIRWSSSTTATTSSTYADLASSLDNLIDAGDIPPLVAALVADPRPHGRIFRRPPARALPGARAAAGARGALRPVAAAAPTGCCSAPASAPSPRSPPPSATRACFGGLVLKSGSFILDEAQAGAPAASGLPPHRPAGAGAPPRAAAAADPRLRLHRRARGAGRREPRARKLLARTRRRCFVQERVGRAPLAQLARPAPRRAALGAPAGKAQHKADGPPGAPVGQRGGTGMGERTVNIGLSLGADICWPIAYESLLEA